MKEMQNPSVVKQKAKSPLKGNSPWLRTRKRKGKELFRRVMR